jgi:hypothetical protein
VGNDPWSHWKAFSAGAGPTRHDAFAPLIDSTEHFAAAARKYLEDAAHATTTAADQAARTFSHFLREQSMVFFQPPWSADSTSGGDPWAAMLDAPALGLTREHQQRWQRTADAARRVADAQRRLQCLWSDALRDAATAFAARIAASGPGTLGVATSSAGAPSVTTLRSLYDTWIDCAEEAYAGAAHSDSFCNALADFVNAGSQWRREFAASVEQWSKLTDLPTRSELNSLTRRLKCVEEQLRAERTKNQPRDAASKPRPTLRPTPRPPPHASRTRRAKRAPKS